MNEFATEEYIKKNIRVRPISSMSGKDERVDHGVGFAGEQTDGEEDARFNKDVSDDIVEERKNVKMRRENFQKSLIAEMQKLEKAKARRNK